MREDGEQARPVETHVGIEVRHLLEHVERFVDLIERGRLDLHPDFAHCRDAEEHGVAETLRDVEQLLGVDEASIERHRKAGRLGRVEQHSQERDLVAHPPSAGHGLVGEREPPLPVATLRQLDGQRREQPGPLRAVLGAGHLDRSFEDLDTLAVDGAGAARAAAVVRERRADEGIVVADTFRESSSVEQRLAERIGVGPSLSAPERDEKVGPRRFRSAGGVERVEGSSVPADRIFGRERRDRVVPRTGRPLGDLLGISAGRLPVRGEECRRRRCRFGLEPERELAVVERPSSGAEIVVERVLHQRVRELEAADVRLSDERGSGRRLEVIEHSALVELERRRHDG